MRRESLKLFHGIKLYNGSVYKYIVYRRGNIIGKGNIGFEVLWYLFMISWITFALSVPFMWILGNKITLTTHSERRKHILLGSTLVFFSLFLFRACRADFVGGDLATYKELFYRMGQQNIKTVLQGKGYEKGFLFLIKVLHTIWPHFRFLLVFTAIIFSFALTKFIIENSCNPGLSIYIYISMYFLGATFNNERQAIAISFLFFSYKYVKERKICKFLFFIFLAVLFHVTSILFVLVYFAYDIKINKKYWLCVIAVATVSYFGTIKILLFLTNEFYPKYAERLYQFAGGGYEYFLVLVILIIASVLLLNNEQINIPEIRILVHMMVIAAIIQIFAFQVGIIYRATRLFSIAMIFLIPCLIERMEMKSRRMTILIVFVLVGIYFLFELNRDGIGVVPYRLWWR